MSKWNRSAGVVQKAIPENPKYKNVRPRVDSGASIRRYIERVQESQRNIKQRNDEVFKRIKITSLVKLIIEVFNETLLKQCKESAINLPCRNPEEVNKQDLLKSKRKAVIQFESGNETSNREPNKSVKEDVFSSNRKTYNLIANEFSNVSMPRAESVTSVSSTRSTLHSLITGTGEMDMKYACNNTPDKSQYTVHEPYILLDVRDSDAYQQCHITTAKNYPYSMLIRTCNYETKDMLACKNSKDKIIVLYDEDESIAPRVATTLVQRGYSNIFMLSGGLKLAFYRFPEGLIEGVPPISCQQDRTVALNDSMSGLIRQVDKTKHFASKNCFTLDSIRTLQTYLEKCLALEDVSLECRSTQSLIRKSTYHHPLTSRINKGRIIPWK